MQIVSAYLETAADMAEADSDMEYRDGYYFYKTSNCFMLYPILWWQDQSSISVGTPAPSSYKESTYPNHWGLLYFTAHHLGAWWDNPPSSGGGVEARDANNNDTSGKAAFYVFANRADALSCLHLGQSNKKVTGVNYSNNVHFNARMRYYQPTSYACIDVSGSARQWHSALADTHDLIVSNIDGTLWCAAVNGNLKYIKTVGD